MSFNTQYILLILFVNLKTGDDSLYNSSKILNYNVSQILFEKLEREFEEFKEERENVTFRDNGHSDQKSEFKKFKTEYYMPIKDYITIAPNNYADLEKIIDLIWKAQKFIKYLFDWETKNLRCKGHIFMAHSVDELKLVKEKFEDTSCIKVGKSVIEYRELNLPSIPIPMMPVFSTLGGVILTAFAAKELWNYHLQKDENLTQCYFEYSHTFTFLHDHSHYNLGSDLHSKNNVMFYNDGKVTYCCDCTECICKSQKDLIDILDEIVYILIKTYLKHCKNIDTPNYGKNQLYYSYMFS